MKLSDGENTLNWRQKRTRKTVSEMWHLNWAIKQDKEPER